MSRASHKWKTISGKARAAIALASAGTIVAVAVGVSSASTVVPGHDQAPSQAPRAASGKRHPFGLGAVPSKSAWRQSMLRQSVEPRLEATAPRPTIDATKPKKKRQALPASVDLTKYAATPGDQGQVGACVAWSIDYSAYSILEHEQGISGGPQAPMYTYSQIVQGQNVGTSPEQHFQIATTQGVDSKSDYSQGDFDYTTQPTANEIANAAKWKLSGYTPLHTGNQIKNDVESALSQREPVTIAIPVYDSFFYLTRQQAASYAYYPASGEQFAGGHEITIVGYNSKGVRVENSWGRGWGDHGYINLSWNYLANQVWEANAVGKLIKR
ncbi:C1 family peptidase [Streptantibioticus ferralitis]|uniref:C1 family peptidase n=1 Tax=Streptantibioticus ferralitis TaxID=236510 RepID=A0ABT5Z412_9ACTN|nr:C1 family peptidase [Streptantibioticus ferralitis]MDF2258566.1 C1 family peptidase [Streptantibioticus ferralitis]